MSIFKQRTMRPNQLATLRELESKVSVGKVRCGRAAPRRCRRLPPRRAICGAAARLLGAQRPRGPAPAACHRLARSMHDAAAARRRGPRRRGRTTQKSRKAAANQSPAAGPTPPPLFTHLGCVAPRRARDPEWHQQRCAAGHQAGLCQRRLWVRKLCSSVDRRLEPAACACTYLQTSTAPLAPSWPLSDSAAPWGEQSCLFTAGAALRSMNQEQPLHQRLTAAAPVHKLSSRANVANPQRAAVAPQRQPGVCHHHRRRGAAAEWGASGVQDQGRAAGG